eukprot:1732848-Alexandrium_andersonii.AAC.1
MGGRVRLARGRLARGAGDHQGLCPTSRALLALQALEARGIDVEGAHGCSCLAAGLHAVAGAEQGREGEAVAHPCGGRDHQWREGIDGLLKLMDKLQRFDKRRVARLPALVPR